MSEFWENEDEGFTTWMASSLDEHLASAPRVAVRALVQANQGAPSQFPAGLRVAFDGRLSSVLAYQDPPVATVLGTVVAVRTANGTTTVHDGLVFVKWDDDKFMGVHQAHLRLAPTADRRASSAYRRVVSSIGDLGDFFRFGSEGPDLVHKATKDLWSLKRDGGEYVIERLFDEGGKPLKV